MRILFVARHFTYFRNFESVLRELSARGHAVHLAVEREEALGGRAMVDRLIADCRGLTAGFLPPRKDGWFRLATRLRLGLDYLRYLEPAYAQTPRLESRARERAPYFVVRLATTIARGPRGRRLLARWLSGIEQAIPLNVEIRKYIGEQAPDAVLITPLIGVVASLELDCLYASQALGIPTTLCVWSWDHLSSKALIRTLPDRVFVWNPRQRQEAIELHGVPASRVVVTGAQCFDQWFDRQPSRSRAEFCRRVGLPDARPFILWVCSSLFKGSPSEAEFVQRWIAALRDSRHAELRDVNILVRPHPQRMTEWAAFDPSSLPRVALWGGNPVDADSRADYFDSLYHSAAVAGLNTSAFVEGAVVGRPIYAPLPAEYHDNQEGTIHFHYLLHVSGGVLRARRALDEHLSDLAAAVRGEVPDPDRSRRFSEAFVRPHGLSTPSTPLFVDAVESLASMPAPARTQKASGWASVSLRVLRRLYATERGRRWIEPYREAFDDARTRGDRDGGPAPDLEAGAAR